MMQLSEQSIGLLREMARDHIAQDKTGRRSRKKRRVQFNPVAGGDLEFGYYEFEQWAGVETVGALTTTSPDMTAYYQTQGFMTVDDTQTSNGPLTVNKAGFYYVHILTLFEDSGDVWPTAFTESGGTWDVNTDQKMLAWSHVLQYEDTPGTWLNHHTNTTHYRRIYHAGPLSYSSFSFEEFDLNQKLRMRREINNSLDVVGTDALEEDVYLYLEFLGASGDLETS